MIKSLSVALLGFLLTACSSGGGGKAGNAGDRIRIFYNNDNFAYLEPCGCRISPIGGIDRRWNGMKQFPDNSRVFVDAGNLLFKSNSPTEFNSPQWYEQAVGMIEGYNMLGADAVAIGSTEFALGIDRFEELAKGAKFPFLSANIYRKKGGARFAKDRVMIERFGKKIGIFAIFHPSLPLPNELEARDPIEAAREEVRLLRSEGADMVIALAHEGYDNDIILAKKVSGIDMIVGANSQSLLQTPDMENGTLVVQLSNQGQMLGYAEYEASTLPKNRTGFEVVELNAEYNNAPNGMANPMKSLLAVTNLKMTEANRLLDERLASAHQADSATGYQTFLACKDCHGKQAEFQEGKLHAASFLTLVKKKQEMNLDCVKCHSVGLNQKGGFKSISDAFRDANDNPVSFADIKKHMGNDSAPNETFRENPAKIRPDVARFIAALKKASVKKAFAGVQCENCHGGMPDHPFDSSGAGHATKVATTACLQCHTKEQMPAWYDSKGILKKDAVDKAKASVACPR